jgi:hypothetical protein
MKMHSTDEVKKCSQILMFKCAGGGGGWGKQLKADCKLNVCKRIPSL